ncbi:MAG: thermonuclease family protein [Actinomycetota bacterium]
MTGAIFQSNRKLKLRDFTVGIFLLITGCSDSANDWGAGTTSGWTVERYVDGDTIDVRSTLGHVERVRLIGIDTPESGECGYEAATGALALLIKGSKVQLVSGAQTNRDQMKDPRLLRYVEVNGRDIGLAMIEGGWAIAAYDSRTAFGSHDRESLYIRADQTSQNNCPGMSPGRT